MGDTTIGDWIRVRSHWGGRRATSSSFHFRQTYSYYVRFLEAIRHERRFGDILPQLGRSVLSGWPTDSEDILCFSFPWNQTYFFTNLLCLSRDLDFNVICTPMSEKSWRIGTTWHCLPYFHLNELDYTHGIHLGGKLLNVAGLIPFPPLLSQHIIRS